MSPFLFFPLRVDCQMQRIDIRPIMETCETLAKIQFPDQQRNKTVDPKNESKPSNDAPKPLFDISGRVVICETFNISASGSIEQFHAPLPPDASALQLEGPVGVPRTNVDGAKQFREPSPTMDLLDDTEGPDLSHYAGKEDVMMSQMRLDMHTPGK